MTIIKVVEPHAILRLGLLQLIADLITDAKVEGADYAGLFDTNPDSREIDLVILSIVPPEQADNLIQAALGVYEPRHILLLSDPNALPQNIELPPVVSGHVPKSANPEVLQAAVRMVLAGGTCFPPLKQTGAGEYTPAVVEMPTPAETPLQTLSQAPSCQSKLSLQAHAESEMLGLTPRQYEVLVLLARGYPMKTVGRYLNISVATAKAHTETLYQRLDVHNRNAAVYAAVSRGAKLGWTCIGGTQPDATRNEN